MSAAQSRAFQEKNADEREIAPLLLRARGNDNDIRIVSRITLHPRRRHRRLASTHLTFLRRDASLLCVSSPFLALAIFRIAIDEIASRNESEASDEGV